MPISDGWRRIISYLAVLSTRRNHRLPSTAALCIEMVLALGPSLGINCGRIGLQR